MAASNIWTPPQDFTAGEVVTSTKGNQHWRDNLQYLHQKDEFAYNSYNSDGSNFTAETDIVLLGGVVVPTGHDRPLWHEAMLHFDVDNVDTVVQIRIVKTTGGTTTLAKFFCGFQVADQPQSIYIAYREANPGAGTYDYKITALRNAGTGNVQRRGAADTIGWYKVRGG